MANVALKITGRVRSKVFMQSSWKNRWCDCNGITQIYM